MFTVYILHTSSDTFYIGQTKDLEKRLEQHRTKSPQSAKYMRAHTSFTLIYTEEYDTRSEALKREAALKKLSRAQKETIIGFKK